MNVKTYIVGGDILLLSIKSAVKSAGIKPDLQNDTATIWGNQALLDSTTSVFMIFKNEHYYLEFLVTRIKL